MKDIHDIRAPVLTGSAFDPAKMAIAVLGAAACLFLIYAVFVLVKKARKKRAGRQAYPQLPPPLPPRDAALKALELLADMMGHSPRLFYFQLTAVLKKYIGNVYGINASEMTTEELVKALNSLGIDPESRDTLSSFLGSADSVKYAAVPPSPGKSGRDLKWVKTFVETDARQRAASSEES